MKVLLLAVLVLLVGTGPSTLSAQTPEPAQDGDAQGDADNGDQSTAFGDRFTLDPAALAAIDVAPESACAPEVSFHSYGFLSSEDAGPTRLDITRRVQYYSIRPGGLGNLDLTASGSHNLKEFTRTVHSYAGKADLVVSKDEFSLDLQEDGDGLLLVKSFVLLNLVDEIINTVGDHDFDGVTIDFQGALQEPDTRASFSFFVSRLDAGLSRLQDESALFFPTRHQVNVVIPAEGVDARFIRDLSDSVDAFLGDKETVDRLLGEIQNTSIRRKLVTVVPPAETFDPQQLDPGGVGIWSLSQVDPGKPDGVAAAIANEDEKSFLETKIGPYVCPHRVIIRSVVGSLAAGGVIFLSLASVIYDLRGVMRRYWLYFLGALLITVVLFMLLIIADPMIEGFEYFAFLLLLAIAVIYGAWQIWNNRNRANYP